MGTFEIPLILAVQAFDRESAEDRACDIADALGDVFDGSSAVAVIGHDHNLLDRLGIKYDGIPTPRSQ